MGCHHNNGKGLKRNDGQCALCILEVELARIPGMADLMGGTTPRYRYWSIVEKGRSRRTFEYTTETADESKYWAVERRWVKVKGGHRGKIIRQVGFKMRRKAKERAHQWYEKARSPLSVSVA